MLHTFVGLQFTKDVDLACFFVHRSYTTYLVPFKFKALKSSLLRGQYNSRSRSRGIDGFGWWFDILYGYRPPKNPLE